MSSTPPVQEGGSSLHGLPAQKAKPKTEQEAVVVHIARRLSESKEPPQTEAAASAVNLVASSEKAEQRKGIKSLLNGSNATEVEKVGNSWYSKAAISDFATRPGRLGGSITITSPSVVNSFQPSEAIKRPNFSNTVFGQVQAGLIEGGFRNPISATNAILAVASQAQPPSLGIMQSYVNVHQQMPYTEPTLREVHITDRSVTVHSIYTFKPSIDLQGNMIMVGPDPAENAKLEALREARCAAHPEEVWTMESTVDIPRAGFNEPKNTYGKEGCDIPFFLDVTEKRGRHSRRKSVIKAVGSARHSISQAVLGAVKPQQPPTGSTPKSA